MQKKTISMKMHSDLLEYVDQIAEINSTSRSKTIELMVSIVQDYFTNNQLYQEHYARGDLDGRRKFGE